MHTHVRAGTSTRAIAGGAKRSGEKHPAAKRTWGEASAGHDTAHGACVAQPQAAVRTHSQRGNAAPW